MIRGRDVLWNLDAPTAVNNRKREAADSAEILDDRPDCDDQREPNPPRGTRGERKKVNAMVLRRGYRPCLGENLVKSGRRPFSIFLAA